MAALQPPPDEIQSEPSNQHPFSHSTLLLPLLDWQTRDEYRTWFAANILSHAVYRFEKCKEVMSGMYLQRTRRNDEDEDPVSLVQSIAHTLLFVSRSPRAIRSQVALYSLLCCWLWESPNYASEILSDSSLIQLFIEQVSASSCDPLVQGLSGFLLTTLYILDSSPNRTLSSGSIYLIIKERVGFEIFETKLNRLREDKRFLDFGTSTFFDELMIIHFTEHFNQMLREIRISPEDRSKKLVEKEMESGKMALLEQKLEELQSQLNEQAANFEFQRNSMTSTIRDLEQKLYVSRMAFQNIEKEQQDLLLTLAEQDEEINRLRNLHSSFDTNEPKSQPSTMVQLPTGNLIDRSYPYVSPVPLLPEDSTAPNKKELKTDSNLAMVVDL
ncbi:hypothetical protein HMI56_000464 [Coelomomyces lativittatus]|nr:hypothetical protein HMI56_000464 [Coelomomyces lativittatus]